MVWRSKNYEPNLVQTFSCYIFIQTFGEKLLLFQLCLLEFVLNFNNFVKQIRNCFNSNISYNLVWIIIFPDIRCCYFQWNICSIFSNFFVHIIFKTFLFNFVRTFSKFCVVQIFAEYYIILWISTKRLVGRKICWFLFVKFVQNNFSKFFVKFFVQLWC